MPFQTRLTPFCWGSLPEWVRAAGREWPRERGGTVPLGFTAAGGLPAPRWVTSSPVMPPGLRTGRQDGLRAGATSCTCAKGDGTDTRKLVRCEGKPKLAPLVARRTRVALRDNKSAKTGDSSLWEVAADGSNLHPLLPAGTVRPPNGMAAGLRTASTTCSNPGMTRREGNWTRDIWALREKGSVFEKPLSQPVQLTVGPMKLRLAAGQQRRKKALRSGLPTRAASWCAGTPRHGQWVSYLAGISAEMLDFSRDGQWVTYVTYPEGELVAQQGGRHPETRLVTRALRVPDFPRWSPDGKQDRLFPAGYQVGR